MNDSPLLDVVRGTLAQVAPDADLDALALDANLRDELDLDSMDFLNFVIGLHKALGVDIPEADYSKLTTLAGAVTYLAAKSRAAPRL